MNTLRRWFTTVSSDVTDPEERHLAGLLTGILSITIAMACVTLAAQLFFVPDFGPTFTANLVGLLCLAITLGFARTRWYRGAMVVAVLLVQIIAAVAALINPEDPVWWAYQVISILLATLVLSMRQAMAAAGLVVATTVGVLTYNGFDSHHDVPPLIFVVVAVPVLLLVAARRRGLEAWRRRALERSRDALWQAEITADLGHWEWTGTQFHLSRGLQRLLGTAAIMPRAEFLSYMDPTARAQFEALLEGAGGAEIAVEILGGSKRYARVVFEPRERERNRMGVVQELTAQREATEAAEALRVQLLEAERLETLSRVARGVAHDFNNLLSAVVGAAEALPMFPRDERGEIFDDIESVVERGEALTRQLVDFGHRPVADADNAPFGEIVTTMAPILERIVGADILTTEVAESAREVNVQTTRAELEQILLNLVINARDAIDTTAGQRIHVRLEADEVHGTLVVFDDGPGIADDVIDHIFEPFFTTGKASGTGIGLATVKDIVDRAGGTIQATTRTEGGAMFAARLPLRAV